MQNDIVRRPVVRPPAQQSTQAGQVAVAATKTSSEPIKQESAGAQQQAKPADPPPPNSHAETHEIIQRNNGEKKSGHGLAIATAVFIFIGLATTAVYVEVQSDKPASQNPQPTVTTPPQSFQSQQNDTSSITVQP